MLKVKAPRHEIDESYFGGKRKGKRGCGVADEVPMSGILKRGRRVYIKMLLDNSYKALMLITKA